MPSYISTKFRELFTSVQGMLQMYFGLMGHLIGLPGSHFEKKMSDNNLTNPLRNLHQIVRYYSPSWKVHWDCISTWSEMQYLLPDSHFEKWCPTNICRNPWDIWLYSKLELRYYICIWLSNTINAQVKV